VKPSVQENPNAYINLARLFAETSRVVLFPRRLLNIDPPSAYALYQKHSHAGRRFKPVVMTMTGRSAFPFSSFSPILLRRDDSVWCDERFALSSSGASDWQECLWQFWIANYGAVRALSVSESSWPLESTIAESLVRVRVPIFVSWSKNKKDCFLFEINFYLLIQDGYSTSLAYKIQRRDLPTSYKTSQRPSDWRRQGGSSKTRQTSKVVD
jgi:hypothetical protein